MHIPVLLQESIQGLALKPDGVYLDGTLGGGGHAFAIASHLGQEGTFIGCDVDPQALIRAQEKLASLVCQKYFFQKNFSEIDTLIALAHTTALDGILLDLGWSMYQIKEPERGFSFLHTGPLDMRLGESSLTAADLVNTLSSEELATILYRYGDERLSRKIAEAIINYRSVHGAFTTTTELGEVIKATYPPRLRHGKIHPATKSFQALRIAVNDEYGVLETTLHKGIAALAPQGRFAVITFHSGEDRIVKKIFNEYKTQHVLIPITKKPIVPRDEELRINPSSRSAKLRIVEKQ
jgi:16S rRNA (cytosine1402-N4)-methyltransferase